MPVAGSTVCMLIIWCSCVALMMMSSCDRVTSLFNKLLSSFLLQTTGQRRWKNLKLQKPLHLHYHGWATISALIVIVCVYELYIICSLPRISCQLHTAALLLPLSLHYVQSVSMYVWITSVSSSCCTTVLYWYSHKKTYVHYMELHVYL